MGQALILHPGSRCAALESIHAGVRRTADGRLVLSYELRGLILGVWWPPLGAPERTDGLWRRTCFEAFVRAPGDGGYYEFNFSPSTEWAAYRFEGYREGRRDLTDDEMDTPDLIGGAGEDRYGFRAELSLARLPKLDAAGDWRVGVTAVIEEHDGNLSYWSLAHPPGEPDFHHDDAFALTLPVPEAAALS